MSQREEMEQVLGVIENILGRVRENKPQIQFKWWSTGAPMGQERVREWEKDVGELETKLQASRNLLEEQGEYNGATINAIRATLFTANAMDRTYNKPRR
ncbi:hypothetical protein KY311_03805 [Candidatus Woesearchaeota archaeon]|nr:hypothetical protein [Candidatus Woesearchaeota archaeon]